MLKLQLEHAASVAVAAAAPAFLLTKLRPRFSHSSSQEERAIQSQTSVTLSRSDKADRRRYFPFAQRAPSRSREEIHQTIHFRNGTEATSRYSELEPGMTPPETMQWYPLSSR